MLSGYGKTEPDPEKWERGPKFVVQPQHTVVETAEVNKFTYLECIADCLPVAQYEWFQVRRLHRTHAHRP